MKKRPARTIVAADEQPLTFTSGERKKAGFADYKAKEWRMDCRVFAHDVLRVQGDKWQELFWGALSGNHIDPNAKRQLALSACKGPGKSFGMGVGGWWWLFTRWHVRGAAMSITGDNLRDNLWTEMAHLQERSPELTHLFAHRGERIEAKDPKLAKTWWISARSFPQNADKTQQANTLAGLHGRHPIVLADEAGDYPDGVIVAAEAILSSLVDGKPPDGRVILAGNPTSTEGPLYRVVTKDKARWWVYQITSDPLDPNRTPRVDPVWAQDQIDLWGRDSDFVKVNILGQFPSQQANKLIGPELAMEASGRTIEDSSHIYEPLIFGLDVAHMGNNASVLTKRQGLMVWRQREWREVNHMVLADQVAQEYFDLHPAAVFIDNSPVSAGLIDRLRMLGVPVLIVDFGGAPLDSRFFDRRSEMYWKTSQWLKNGGAIPDDVQLRSELVAPNFQMVAIGKVTKLKMESKKEMKARGIASPDKADSLILTHAAPVAGHMVPASDRSALDHLGLSNKTPSIGQIPSLWVPGGTGGFSQKILGGTEESWDPYGGN